MKTAAILFAVLISLLFGVQFALGRVPFTATGSTGELLIALLHITIFAYLVGAYRIVFDRAYRSCCSLRDRIPDWKPEEEDRFDPTRWRRKKGWWMAAAAGAVLGFFGPYLTEPGVSINPAWWWYPAHWTPEVSWHRVLGMGICVTFGVFAYALVSLSCRISELAGRIGDIDLFDPRPLAPFTALGLTNGLMVAVLISLFGLFGLDLGLTMMLAVLGGSSLVLVAIAILMPLYGAHRRLRSIKRAALAWCDGEIVRLRESITHLETSGRLADLFAYRNLVAAAREWPFDTRALRRMTLYILIPLASWIASAYLQAVIERWIS